MEPSSGVSVFGGPPRQRPLENTDPYYLMSQVYSIDEYNAVFNFVLKHLKPFQPVCELSCALLKAGFEDYQKKLRKGVSIEPTRFPNDFVRDFRQHETLIIMEIVHGSIGFQGDQEFTRCAREMKSKIESLKALTDEKTRERTLRFLEIPDEPVEAHSINDDPSNFEELPFFPKRFQLTSLKIEDGYQFLCHLYSAEEVSFVSKYVANLLKPGQHIGDVPLNKLCEAFNNYEHLIANDAVTPLPEPVFSEGDFPGFRLFENAAILAAIQCLVAKAGPEEFRTKAQELRDALTKLGDLQTAVSKSAEDVSQQELWDVESQVIDHSKKDYTEQDFLNDKESLREFYNSVKAEILLKPYPLVYVYTTRKDLLPEKFRQDGIPLLVFDKIKRKILSTINQYQVDYLAFCTNRDQLIDLSAPFALVTECIGEWKSMLESRCLTPKYVALKLAYSATSIVVLCRNFFNVTLKQFAFVPEQDFLFAQEKLQAMDVHTLSQIYELHKCFTKNDAVLNARLAKEECAFCEWYGHFSNHCLRYLSREARIAQLIALSKCMQCGFKQCNKKNRHKLGKFQCRWCWPNHIEYGKVEQLTEAELINCNHLPRTCLDERRWAPNVKGIPRIPGDQNGDHYYYMADFCVLMKATKSWDHNDWKQMFKILLDNVTVNHSCEFGEPYLRLLPEPERIRCIAQRNSYKDKLIHE